MKPRHGNSPDSGAALAAVRAAQQERGDAVRKERIAALGAAALNSGYVPTGDLHHAETTGSIPKITPEIIEQMRTQQ